MDPFRRGEVTSGLEAVGVAWRGASTKRGMSAIGEHDAARRCRDIARRGIATERDVSRVVADARSGEDADAQGDRKRDLRLHGLQSVGAEVTAGVQSS